MKPLENKRKDCGPVVRDVPLIINNKICNFGVHIDFFALKVLQTSFKDQRGATPRVLPKINRSYFTHIKRGNIIDGVVFNFDAKPKSGLI